MRKQICFSYRRKSRPAFLTTSYMYRILFISTISRTLIDCKHYWDTNAQRSNRGISSFLYSFNNLNSYYYILKKYGDFFLGSNSGRFLAYCLKKVYLSILLTRSRHMLKFKLVNSFKSKLLNLFTSYKNTQCFSLRFSFSNED